MIGVIIAAGIGVDLWDARQSRKPVKTAEIIQADEEGKKRLVEENERLKTENALLNMRNDALRKQVEELTQKPLDPPQVEVVKDEKPPGD